MKKMNTGTAPVRSSDFVIRTNDYSGRIMSGIVEHSGSGDFAPFHGLLSLIDIIQSRLDELAFPQATMELRKWSLPPHAKNVSELDSTESVSDRGVPEDRPGTGNGSDSGQTAHEINRVQASRPGQSLACFVLRVQFRHNACWQGSLAWMEGKKSLPFRSVLELVSLLGLALDSASGYDQPVLNWDHKMSVS